MDNYQKHLEPYRHLVREIRSIPAAFKQESSTSNNREDLQPYRHMVQNIQSGRRTEVQPLTWSCSETTSPLTVSSTEKILVQKPEEIAQKLQTAEQRLQTAEHRLRLFEQRTATLEASLIASRMEKQQLELALSQFQGQLEQQAQGNREQTKRLEQLQQLTDQQREAAQAQQLQAENTQLPAPVNVQQSETLDIASQGSFPMVVLFTALVVVAFAVVKLTLVIWQGLRSLSTVAVRVGNLQSQAVKISQVESRWTGWVEGTAK